MTRASEQNMWANQRPLPPSLADWFDKPTLVRLALEAVQETDSTPTLGDERSPDATSRAQFRESLTLVTYCYAAAVYGSRQIEIEATRDDGLRYLCSRRSLDGNVIRQFRRQHRERIHQSLTRLLSRAREHLAACGWSRLFTDECGLGVTELLNLKSKIGPELSEHFAEDAARRICAAIQADSMALDD